MDSVLDLAMRALAPAMDIATSAIKTAGRRRSRPAPFAIRPGRCGWRSRGKGARCASCAPARRKSLTRRSGRTSNANTWHAS